MDHSQTPLRVFPFTYYYSSSQTRETALLYDAEVNPETSKERVAVVIAHELAHQVTHMSKS